LILRNVISRVWRRVLEIPSRGLPAGVKKDLFDAEHGTNTSGIVWLTNLQSQNFASGIRYEPCPPRMCEVAIEQAGIDPTQFHFIDVGCGKGRALIIASSYGFHQLVGVEYSAALCRVAERNLATCKIEKAQVIHADAAEFSYPRANTLAFFFHPFGAAVLKIVLDRLRTATEGYQLVIAYLGAGKDFVAEDWLVSFCDRPDLRLLRKSF
jgi:SAM-dependent methyltransferase